MFRKPVLAFLAALACAGFLTAPAAAAEVDCDDIYCFSAQDFSQEALAGICITDLPDDALGRCMLGSRVLREGDVLTAQQVSQMTFAPALTESDAAAQICYLPIGQDALGEEAAMTIGIRGKENQAPAAEDSALETYKNLANTGRLKVTDPEGEAMTFTVVRQPRRGSVAIGEDGSFTYTPKKNKVGVDSFVYTATDASGKTSREATVTITILKPTESTQYTDTLGMECRFAAEWMKNTGIFVGEQLSGNPCFSPEKEVTRGEFIAMLVKALDIPTEEALTTTGYTDEIPAWLRPYLAAALRSGLTADLPDQETFGAMETVTGAEVSVMLKNALDLTVPLAEETGSETSDTVPAWAASALAAANEQGFCLEADAPLTRGQAATILYQAVQLANQEEVFGL